MSGSCHSLSKNTGDDAHEETREQDKASRTEIRKRPPQATKSD